MVALLLILAFCSRSCAVTLPQPAAIAAEVGSSVNLSCEFRPGADRVTEKNLYWYMPGPQEDSEYFVFPNVAPGIPNNLCESCVWRTNQNNDTDMSLTIADVRLLYTGTYVCHMSVRVNSKKKPVSGNGTYLLVHKSLDTSINVTTNSILCRSEVQEVKNVFLIWDYEGGPMENLTYHQALKSSYEISTELQIGKIECRGQENVTAVCLLQYMGNTLTNRSIEFPCLGSYAGGGMTSQPVLLYVTLLTSSLLILLIIILVSCVRRRRRREESDIVYTNIENNNSTKKRCIIKAFNTPLSASDLHNCKK